MQLKAAVAVNTEMLLFYWELGADIVAQQASQSWGSGFLENLSRDLMQEFPEMKGFSKRNLELVRQWYRYWSKDAVIAKQAVAQLIAIPWGHNLAILSKCRSHTEALYYVQQTQRHGWSRAVLTHQIESGLWQREGKALTNFAQTLPAPQSDLAAQMLKDPYVFDFSSLTPEHSERELERALMGWEIKINGQVMDKVLRGMARLEGQFAQSAKLEDESRKNLAGLGYDF